MFTYPQNLHVNGLILPDTIEVDPEGWFRLAEYNFWRSRVTDEKDMFKHILHAMKPRIRLEMEDLTLKTAQLPYSTLKKKIIERILTRQVEKVEKCLENEDMTQISKGKPSELLKFVRHRAISKRIVNETVHQRVWINHLPKDCQNVLKKMRGTRLDILVEIADRFKKDGFKGV